MYQLLRILAFVLPVFFVLGDLYLRYSFVWLERISVFAVLPILAWNIGNWLYDRWNVQTVEVGNKSVFITGCDTGFGNLLARRLCNLGMGFLIFILDLISNLFPYRIPRLRWGSLP